MNAVRIRNCCCWLLFTVTSTTSWGQQPAIIVSADQALSRLIEGNRRYSRHKERHPDESLAHRKELETGQHPFAVILGCSDSRVPPELIFDQGLGDLDTARYELKRKRRRIK